MRIVDMIGPGSVSCNSPGGSVLTKVWQVFRLSIVGTRLILSDLSPTSCPSFLVFELFSGAE